jgi:hypothetical protein
MALDSRVASFVSGFLSAHDEIALESVETMVKACTDPEERNVIAAFLDDPAAVDAFMGLFARPKCNMAPVFSATSQLLSVARKPARALLLRLLSGPTPRQRVKDAINKLSPDTIDATVTALGLFATMLEHNAKQTTAKYGRKVPMQSAAFADSVPYALNAVKPARVKLLIAFFTAKHVEVATSAVTQHGCLTRLAEDAVELAKREANLPLVASSLRALSEAFVANVNISAVEKRAALNSQRGVTKALTTLLGVPAVAEATATLLRLLVNDVAEPSRDYVVVRDAEDSRMPNFVLFTLLRHLRPKHRTLDAHLVVFILYRCPDLYRPYLDRVAKKLPEFEDSISIPRASVAVCNVLSRVFLCPLPEYVTSQSARLLDSTMKAKFFYDLTPEAAADEVVPVWFGEAAHRLVTANAGNALMLTFLLQCMQAAVNRAAALKRTLAQTLTSSREYHRAAGVNQVDKEDDVIIASLVQASDIVVHEIDADAFISQFDNIIQDRLPKREAMMPHFAHYVKASIETTPGAAYGVAAKEDTRSQFVAQRVYLFLNSAATTFGWRMPWTGILPTPTHSWSLDTRQAILLRGFNATSIRSLCMIILNNLSRAVKLPKLLYVNMSVSNGDHGNGKGSNKHKKKPGDTHPAEGAASVVNQNAPPLLLELLYWVLAARDQAKANPVDDVSAIRSVAFVLLWTVQSSVTGAAVDLDEIALWLKCLTHDTATLLIHAIGYFANLSPKIVQTHIANAQAAGRGMLTHMAAVFVQKQQEKASTAEEKPAAGQSEWSRHVRDYLPLLAETIATVEKRWAKRGATAEALLQLSKHAAASSAPVAPAAHHSMLLRRSALSATKAADQHTVLIEFFARNALPAVVHNDLTDAPRVAHLLAANDAHAQIDTLARDLSANRGDSSRCRNWVFAHLIHRAVGHAGPQTPAPHAAATDLCSAVLDALVETSPPRDDALATLGYSVLAFVCVRHLTARRVSWSDDLRARVAAALLSLYNGTLSAVDRTLYAALALAEHTPASNATAAGDDVSTSESGTPDDGEQNDAAVSDDEDALESDEEHPVVRDSVILGPRPARRAPRSEAHRAAETEAAASLTPAPTQKSAPRPRRRAPAVLQSLKNARFLTGGASCLAKATAEVETLTTIVESLTDREIIQLSMKMPLRINTPVPEEASRPPLRLIFPDVADRQRQNAHSAYRWYAALPNAGGVIEPFECDPVSASVYDPRFLLPLLHVVSSLRYKHVVSVPSTAVLRLVPLAVRSLSSLDGPLRRLAMDCLALMYRSLHPLRRLIVNAVRLQLQKSVDPKRHDVDSAPPRLLTVYSAHFTLAFNPIGNPDHPLHDLTTESLNLQDERVVPLDDLLVRFPSTAVVGLPTLERPNELITTPHLRHLLEQLRRSCVSWPDYAFMERRNVVPLLCIDAGLLRRDPTLRASVLSTLGSICLCHAEDVAVRAAVNDHIVPWLLTCLHELCDPQDVASFTEPALDYTALLRKTYPFFRTLVLHHRRTVSTLVAVLRFAHAHRILSRGLLYDSLHVIALAWKMAGQAGGVLADCEERTFVRHMIDAVEQSGITAMTSAARRGTQPLLQRLKAFTERTHSMEVIVDGELGADDLKHAD